MKYINLLKTLLVTLLLFAQTSWGSDWYPSVEVTQKQQIAFEPLQCPTIGKDYSQMLGQLQSLQDSISKDANCGQLAKNLQSIGHLAGDRRTTFLDAIEKVRGGETLKDSEMQSKVIQYVEDVTVAAGSLGVMLAEGDQCFGKKDPTAALTTLSSFVNEASTLLSTVGGPWGSALAIAGKVSAGFLTGVSKFIASRPGFKFHNKKDWQGYVESLCAFHEQQEAIDALIHPELAIDELQQIHSDLQSQLDLLEGQIPQSQALSQMFTNQDNAGLLEISQQINASTQSELGVIMVQLLSAQRWIDTRTEKIIAEANDPLAPSKYLVQKYRDEIETFMVDNQAPKFISFQEKEARTALKDLNFFVSREGVLLFQQMGALNPSIVPDNSGHPYYMGTLGYGEILQIILQADEMTYFKMGDLGAQVASSILYFKREVNQKWDAVKITNGTKASFCAFFERAGYLNNSLRSTCHSRRGQQIEDDIAKYESYGLSNSTPIYLRRAGSYQGKNWREALGAWVDSL